MIQYAMRKGAVLRTVPSLFHLIKKNFTFAVKEIPDRVDNKIATER